MLFLTMIQIPVSRAKAEVLCCLFAALYAFDAVDAREWTFRRLHCNVRHFSSMSLGRLMSQADERPWEVSEGLPYMAAR